MALTKDDLKFYKSEIVTDTPTNGGRMDDAKEIVSNIKYNLFPRVSYTERVNGVTRYRKMFVANRNVDNEPAYGGLFAILKPSNGDDVFYIKAGTQDDTQADLTDTGWQGSGRLNEDISAGDTQIRVIFEDNNVYIPASGMLVIGKYNASATDEDLAFTDVHYLTVVTPEQINTTIATVSDGQTEYLYNIPADQPIQPGTLTISFQYGGQTITWTDNGRGLILGDYRDDGSTDYTNTILLSFSEQPDPGTDIVATYQKKFVTWSGNEATIELADSVPIDYSASEEVYVGVALQLGDLIPTIENFQVTSVSGVLDSSNIKLFNNGTIYDSWTITFLSPDDFSVSGTKTGSLPLGKRSIDYAPLNSKTGVPLFKIPFSAWGGSWQSGDTIQFTTYPAAKAVWWKEVVPAGANREANNLVIARFSVE